MIFDSLHFKYFLDKILFNVEVIMFIYKNTVNPHTLVHSFLIHVLHTLTKYMHLKKGCTNINTFTTIIMEIRQINKFFYI